MSASTGSSKQFFFVFVYGTLKQNFLNYERYLRPSLERGKALLCSPACHTTHRYPLRIFGQRSVPVLYDRRGTGCKVKGELYFVDDDVLNALDMLEGVHLSFYYRTTVEIVIERWAESLQDMSSLPNSLEAFIYMQEEFKSEVPLADGNNIENYDDELHSSYQSSSDSADSEISKSATRNPEIQQHPIIDAFRHRMENQSR